MKRNLRANQKHSFWVYNITNTNICLSDLALTIPAWRSYNLLDNKHFKYTLAQLESSAINGSLFKKQDKLKISNNPPEIIFKPALNLSKDVRHVIPRSAVKIEEKYYPELPNSDEKFADEFSEPDK